VINKPNQPFCAAWVFSAATALTVLSPTLAIADVWVWEPSAALDLRVDDNYTINTQVADPVNATRLVGSLGLSRESQATTIKGLLRVDGLLQQSENESSELSSNKIVFFDTKFNSERLVYGFGLNYKQDTPSRDIAADITDPSVTAADTGASVTQDTNLGRERFVFSPNLSYKLTRRTSFDARLTYTKIEHELPTPAEAIAAQWALANGGGTPPANLSLADVGGVFTVEDELDDFEESAISFGLKHSLSPLVDLTASVSFKAYSAGVELDKTLVGIPPDPSAADSPLIPDPNENNIYRKPRRDSKSNTTTVVLGYERSLSPTLKIGINAGAYMVEKDDTDFIRDGDDVIATPEDIADLTGSENGWLGGITLSKNTSITRYTARFGVDVLPSDIGSQVESLDITGDVLRKLSPRMDFAFRARAYEPDTIRAREVDKFSRRFISFEPKIIWEYNRAWTVELIRNRGKVTRF